MGVSIILTAAAIYMGIVGLVLILAPQYFGVGALPPEPSRELIAFLRLWGSPLLGIAVLDWTARKIEPSKALNAILLGNTVGFGSIAVVDIWGTLNGARPITVMFAVVHSLWATLFIWAWFSSRVAERGRTTIHKDRAGTN